MIKKNPVQILVGLLCAAVLVLAAAVAVFLDSRSPDPILGIFQTAPTEEETQETTEITHPSSEETSGHSQENTPSIAPTEEQVTPPEDLPPSVTIPVEKDPQTGEPAGISFPCQIPEYDLVIAKAAPYSGMYVEDGTNANVQDVAMLMVRNEGDFPVEYTQICVSYGDEELLFHISALPAGENVVVQEKNGKSIPGDKATAATALVVQRASMDMSENQVQVTDNGDNTLTIRNLTDKTIPTVRVFYKYYMEEEDVFVGGISFTVRITRLEAGASVTIQPSHYTSKTSRVVMVSTYDSEV